MYSLYLHKRIVRLSCCYQGKALAAVLGEESFHVSVTGVYYFLKKFRFHL